MASITIGDTQKVVIRLEETDDKGQPATPAAGVWSVDRTDLLTLVPAEDGLSATVAAVGPLGTASVAVTVGALAPVTATVTIVGGAASKVELAFDTPTAQ